MYSLLFIAFTIYFSLSCWNFLLSVLELYNADLDYDATQIINGKQIVEKKILWRSVMNRELKIRVLSADKTLQFSLKVSIKTKNKMKLKRSGFRKLKQVVGDESQWWMHAWRSKFKLLIEEEMAIGIKRPPVLKDKKGFLNGILTLPLNDWRGDAFIEYESSLLFVNSLSSLLKRKGKDWTMSLIHGEENLCTCKALVMMSATWSTVERKWTSQVFVCYHLTNKTKIDLDVFRSYMKDCICSEVDGTIVITP